MSDLVTIGIPVYRRLHYLPGVLSAVARQDYPDIELIVSDNGQNGTAVRDIIENHYFRPYRFRQTEMTVDIPTHHHQVLAEARGEYFVWLADDDLVSRTFVSELVSLVQKHPGVAVAIARQEVIDRDGRVLRRSSNQLPARLSGEDFVKSWTDYGFENYSTVLARTHDVKRCGGYGNFPGGTASDDALLLKLCLAGSVAFSNRCTFQYRWDESSFGRALNVRRLADDLRRFLVFLKTDPMIRAYARRWPARWDRMERSRVRVIWTTYFERWRTRYRGRLSTLQWLRAAFALPFIPAYYRAVIGELWSTLKAAVAARLGPRLCSAAGTLSCFEAL